MITYNSYGSVMPTLDEQRTTAWLRRVAESHGRRVGDINYVFCNDEEILALNQLVRDIKFRRQTTVLPLPMPPVTSRTIIFLPSFQHR